MPRSIFLPILGLMGIVLYGTTRASKPPSLEDGPMTVETSPSGYIEMEPSQPLQRFEAPPPPAAPRLKSDIEGEEEAARRAEAARAARVRAAVADSTADTLKVADYVSAPIVPGD